MKILIILLIICCIFENLQAANYLNRNKRAKRSFRTFLEKLNPMSLFRSQKNLDNYYSFDPDEKLNVPQIIRRHGYPSETHLIQTEDGYLLEIHRIPGNQNGIKGEKPIFLQHGLLGSSADFILNGNTTLAFYLADNGYDVWLGNARGNIYSRAHISLPVSSPKFWNFSWHEMGTKDLPPVLYHISNTTGKPGEIIYVGHSMGSTMSFVLSSILPQVAKNLKLIVSLAPTAFMTHLRSPIRYLAPFVNYIKWLINQLGVDELTPSNKMLNLLSKECEKMKLAEEICRNLLFILAGFNKDEFNMTILPKIVNHDPAGTSTKTVIHYVQEIHNNGNFQQYDYGKAGNIELYGQPNPPLYKLENIKRPYYFVYAENDILTSPVDVERLAKNLTNLIGMEKVPDQIFGHVDFIFGEHAFKFVYQPLVKFLNNYTAQNDLLNEKNFIF